jgi:hypothetical protein
MENTAIISVIPAKAGTQLNGVGQLGTGFRRDDDLKGTGQP